MLFPSKPASTADVTCLRDHIEEVGNYLRKSQLEILATTQRANSNVELTELEKTQWVILLDKGFQGVQDELRAYIPIKKQRGHRLTTEQIEWNKKLSKVRIRCENYYSRLKMWRIASDEFRGDRGSNHELYISICTALTNYQLKLHPLRRFSREF